MELSAELTDDLTSLSDALEDQEKAQTGPFLAKLVPHLTNCLTGTVRGYLGLTIAVLLDGAPVIINTLTDLDTGNVGGSLLLTLLPMGSSNTTGTLAFYSEGLGAFNDLADSAQWIFNLDCAPLMDSLFTAA